MSIPLSLRDFTKSGASVTSNPAPVSPHSLSTIHEGHNPHGAQDAQDAEDVQHDQGVHGADGTIDDVDHAEHAEPGSGPGSDSGPSSGPGLISVQVLGTPGTRPAKEMTDGRFALWGFGLSLGLFLAMLDTSIVATCLYSIAADFQTMKSINWVALAYTLSYLGCAVLFARISDIVGRRAAFMCSFAIFIAFSLACGFARTLNKLIIFRAFQGIGGSGLYSLTIITFPELTPMRRKKHIASIIGIVIAVSGIMGPLLGGMLSRWTSWRWVFWINGPIGIVAAAVFWLGWPDYIPDIKRRTWREVDYISTILLIAGSVLIIFSIQSAGLNSTSNPWRETMFWCPLACGVFSMCALVLWEWLLRLRKIRLATAIPLELLCNRVYCFAVIHSLLLGFAYMLCVFTFPLRFQVVYHRSSLEAGLMLLPMLVAAGLGSIASGRLNHNRHNRLAETLMAATLFMLIGCALEMTAEPVEGLEPKVLGSLTLIGLGFGLSAAGTTMLCAAETPLHEHATAQAINAQFRILGGSIGIAVSTAIQASYSHSQLAGILTPEQLADLAGAANTMSAAEYQAVRVAYTDGLDSMMGVCCAVLGAAFVLTMATYSGDRLAIPTTFNQRNLEEQQRVAEERQFELSP